MSKLFIHVLLLFSVRSYGHSVFRVLVLIKRVSFVFAFGDLQHGDIICTLLAFRNREVGNIEGYSLLNLIFHVVPVIWLHHFSRLLSCIHQRTAICSKLKSFLHLGGVGHTFRLFIVEYIHESSRLSRVIEFTQRCFAVLNLWVISEKSASWMQDRRKRMLPMLIELKVLLQVLRQPCGKSMLDYRGKFLVVQCA